MPWRSRSCAAIERGLDLTALIPFRLEGIDLVPWLKAGDNAATHPAVMSVQADAAAEPWLVNEAFGFVTRCALQSAGHMTDYRVDIGTAAMLGGSRWERLVKIAVAHRLMSVTGRGRNRQWTLIQDDELFHIRLRADVEWERQRQRDNRNPALTCPVRARDGDGCRFCGQVVNWNDRNGKSGRGGTYDHLDPDPNAETTVSKMCVSCKKCNSRRGGGEDLALQPVPTNPIYGKLTVEHLIKNGYSVPTHGTISARDNASDPVSSGSTQPVSATPPPAGHRAQPRRPGTQPDTAPATSVDDSTDDGPGVRAAPSRDTAQQCDPSQGGLARPGPVDQWAGVGADAASRASPPDWATDERERVTARYDSGRPGRHEVYLPGRDGDGTGRVGPGLDGSGADPPVRRARRGRRRGSE